MSHFGHKSFEADVTVLQGQSCALHTVALSSCMGGFPPYDLRWLLRSHHHVCIPASGIATLPIPLASISLQTPMRLQGRLGHVVSGWVAR